ncbi:hypothetical protein M5D96_013921 [Drosophila gunungcola]|uniref:Secreted protein n=1 Tax=Drosophila gunungcola TaxID=103775 RepID=A0A9Q0BHX8_9MUSC|nr:hypothetical protein M5D96_013921 [Drosophila gunungcola]
MLHAKESHWPTPLFTHQLILVILVCSLQSGTYQGLIDSCPWPCICRPSGNTSTWERPGARLRPHVALAALQHKKPAPSAKCPSAFESHSVAAVSQHQHQHQHQR